MTDDTYLIFQMIAIVFLLFALYTIIFIGVTRSSMSAKTFKLYFNIFKVFATVSIGAALIPAIVAIINHY